MATKEHPEQHLYELLKSFDTAMLMTHAGSGGVSARPMHIAELRPDGDAIFATDANSAKTSEIEANPEVMLVMQDGSKFATISGRAHISDDLHTIERLWSEAWRVWFPGGKDDPSLRLIKVEAQSGEYWDNAGMQGAKYMLKAAGAYLSGTTPTNGEKEHGKVKY